jgi:hypothetical protein
MAKQIWLEQCLPFADILPEIKLTTTYAKEKESTNQRFLHL